MAACDGTGPDEPDESCLILHNRGLSAIPHIQHENSVQMLVLSFNKLNTLFEAGCILERLRVLDLSHNHLTGTLPGLRGTAPHLERCNLSFNRLTDLKIIRGCSALTVLQADNNRLASIPDICTTLTSLPKLETLTLFDNPCMNSLYSAESDSAVSAVKTATSVRVTLKAEQKFHIKESRREACLMMIINSCQTLQQVCLQSPYHETREAGPKGKKKLGAQSIAEGGDGTYVAATAARMHGYIIVVTPALVDAARQWCNGMLSHGLKNNHQTQPHKKLTTVTEEGSGDAEPARRVNSRMSRNRSRNAADESAFVGDGSYRILFSGEVLAGWDGEGGLAEEAQVALRALPDGTTICKWPDGKQALNVSKDERATSALSAYHDASSVPEPEGAPAAFHVRAFAAESSSGEPNIDIDGFGVGFVRGTNDAVFLRFNVDGSGYQADLNGLPMRQWTSTGELASVDPEFRVYESSKGGWTGSGLSPIRTTPRKSFSMQVKRSISPGNGTEPDEPPLASATAALADDTRAMIRQVLTELGITDTETSIERADGGLDGYIATTKACAYILGNNMAVIYSLSRFELKIFVASQSFRYELAVPSSTAGTANNIFEPETGFAASAMDDIVPISFGAVQTPVDEFVLQGGNAASESEPEVITPKLRKRASAEEMQASVVFSGVNSL